MLYQGLQASSWRGEDATGVALCPIDKLDHSPIVYKKAFVATDFVRTDTYHRLVSNIEQYAYVLGHARASTTDRYNRVDMNAHPFTFKDVTLTHNGHISNLWEIKANDFDHAVDSAHITANLAGVEPNDATKVLETLKGAYALVWFDRRDKSLNFARNESRPLVFMYVEKENTMYWMSELETLWALMQRNVVLPDGKFKFLPKHCHVKFNIQDLRGYKKFPFQPRQFQQSHTTTAALGTRWSGETRRLLEANSSQKSNVHDGKRSSEQMTVSLPSIEPKHSLRPTTRRKIKAAEMKLKELGVRMGQPISFIPEAFESYKNQKDNRGVIRGRHNNIKSSFEIGHITRALWQAVNNRGRIYGRVANVKKDGKGHNVIVCDYDPEFTRRFSFDRTVSPSQTEDAEDKYEYCGPGGHKLTKQEYDRLVKIGCAWCSVIPSYTDHDRILWVNSSNQFLGVCCTANKEALEAIGVELRV